ncbi:hypothetical protein DIPPA_30094 [Diplonema papillatum]|nr:hypothetical protein DIPPA_30094 [Diplonema papillatum]
MTKGNRRRHQKRGLLLASVGVLVVVAWCVSRGPVLALSPEAQQQVVAPPLAQGAHVNVWASGGLGNRLASVLNGVWLAHALDRHLVVHWPLDNACQAPFTALFTPRGDASQKITVVPRAPDPSAFHIALLTPRLHSRATDRSSAYRSTRADFSLAGWEKMEDADSVHRLTSGWARNTSLAHDAPFLSFVRELFGGREGPTSLLYANDRVAQGVELRQLGVLFARAVAVVPEVIDMAAGIFRQHGWRPGGELASRPVGVHLRGTDAARVADVPAMARDVRKRFPGRRYFVCGDSRALEDDFAAAVASPGRVVRRVKRALPVQGDPSLPFRVMNNGARVLSNIVRSGDSVVEALADLLLLSRTELPNPRLKGSVVSSFIDIAAVLQKMDFDPFAGT